MDLENEDINVDELMAQIEAPTPPRADTAPEPETEAPAEEAAPDKWEAPEWSHFEWNGKKLFPDSPDKAKAWISQGFNYSQRMGEFNKTKAEQEKTWQERDAQWKQLQRYKEVDDYAQKNKQWWEHVQKGWEEREKLGQPQVDANLQPIQEKLAKFEEFIGSLQAEREQEQLQKLDQSLEAEIESIRKDHPNIDLNAVDPASGQTLELQVLKHGTSNNIPTFKAAFWDYLGPKLIADAKASGREAVAKDTQAKAKAGLLGKTPTPVKGLKPVVNTKAPWSDKQFDPEEILKEFANGG